MNNVPTLTHPKLFDKAIQKMQVALKNNLSWLDYSFGRAERLIKEIDGKRYYTPNVYLGNQQYALVLPDTYKFGNYSFFVLHEPQEVIDETPIQVRLKAPFSLIVWLNINEAIANEDERNTEYIKEQILMVIEDTHLPNGHFSINKIYERAESVFEGFTLDEVKNQFMMAPYCGFRFQGEITITNDCIL